MVDDQNCHARLALQGSEVAEQRSHLTGHILIGGVKTDQGIEDEMQRDPEPDDREDDNG